MRFKPPPPRSTIGWRVEFRPCEAQITDFENAAFVCFVVLLTRVILTYKLNFLIPISKVDENMQRAQKRDAVLNQKFWFRKDLASQNSTPSDNNSAAPVEGHTYTEMTIDEIINGKVRQYKNLCKICVRFVNDFRLFVMQGEEFPGLLPLISSYLSSVEVDADTHCTIYQYLRLIQKRASGELMTAAHWIRQFVANHPDYKHDSVVSESVNYDLLYTMEKIQTGSLDCPSLMDHTRTKTRATIPEAIRNAEKCATSS